MAHLTLETKERFRAEAARRNKSMSALVSEVIEEWLEEASTEEISERSNKRQNTIVRKHPKVDAQVILKAIPGHIHTIGADGYPSCGCEYEWVNPPQDVPLPLEPSKE